MAERHIGDPVYGSFGKFGRIDVRQGVITKVTPSGQIVADFGGSYPRRFNGRGWEIGVGEYDRGYLIERDQFERQCVAGAIQSDLGKARILLRGGLKDADDLRELIAKLSEIEAEISRLSPERIG
jgi:hypothetical protein